MILQPGVIALLISSLGTAGLLLYAAGIGLQILRHWDSSSGSERQLLLERKTALVASIVGLLLCFQLLTLALFVYTADDLHSLFTGAMCAAGTLNVNRFGYPALLAKLVCTLLSGIWLILNRVDSLAPDFPLTRVKFTLLLLLAPLATAEAGLLSTYVLLLQPDIITSCCGSLFEGGKATLSSLLSGLPPVPTAIGHALLTAVTVGSGLLVWRKNRGHLLLTVGSLATFISGIAALISYYGLYYYEIPTHHCPFCLLQPEYGRIGFLLYTLLIIGVIAGCGCGALHLCRTQPSLSRIIPPLQRRLALWTSGSFALFLLLVAGEVARSPFRL